MTHTSDWAQEFIQMICRKRCSELEAGSVYINCFEAVMIPTPFGGCKQSGLGRDL